MPKTTPATPVGRDAFLAGLTLAEGTVDTAIGPVICREITGQSRADLTSEAFARDKTDVGAYRRSLILAGTVNPDSPEGARTPLFDEADMDAVMAKPSSVIEAICDKIEELSGLGTHSRKAKEDAGKD